MTPDNFTLIGVDTETYYDDLYSLGDNKMTTLEYITDRRFHAHMVSVKEEGQSAFIVHHEDIQSLVDSWKKRQAQGERIAILAQNTLFDALILSYHYGFVADYYYDTKAMATGLWHHQSSSLKNLVIRLWPNDPTMRKGDELGLSKGVRDLTPEIREALSGYCCKDTELCWAAFHEMLPMFPAIELPVINMLTRMFVDPWFELDFDLIERYIPMLERVRKETICQSMLHTFAETYNPDNKNRPQFVKEWDLEVRKGREQAEDREFWMALKVLNSNKAFEAWLTTNKIAIPRKPNDKGVLIPAFGQQDLGYQQMTARYPQFAHVWAARKVAKSVLTLSRSITYRDTARRFGGRLPMPLKYSAAHTHRFGGGEGLNVQNMPRNAPENHPHGDLRPGALRRALLAPADMYVYVADSSNIEARLLAYMSDNEPLLQVFRDHGDPYIWMAQDIYNQPLNKHEHPTERGVGKACFAANTKVLTDHGVKPIIAVRLTDKVWDGIEWVSHKGLLPRGTQRVLTLSGISVTHDHKILCETQWLEAQSLAADARSHSLALATGAASLPSPATFADFAAACQASSYGATAAATNTPLTRTTSSPSSQRDAHSAPTVQGAASNTGPTPRPCPTTTTAPGCSTDSQPPSPDATTPTTPDTNTTDDAASACTQSGAATAPNSCATSRPSTGGTAPNSTSTESTTTRATSPATSASSTKEPTPATSESSPTSKPASPTSKPVFDLLDCGPRHRFTIITDDGPLIVHNCLLGLGYGMGVPKFTDYLNTGPLGMPPIFFRDASMYAFIVSTFRTKNYQVVDFWARCDQWLWEMSQPDCDIDFKMLRIRHQKIILPSGLALEYPNLRYENGRWVYDSKEEGNFTSLWGGSLTENIMQALATEFIKHCMRKIDEYFLSIGGRVVLQVHDEVAAIGPRENADHHMAVMLDCMRDLPDWCKDLPVDAEGGWSCNYVK